LWYQARLLAGLDKPDLALKAIDQAITLDPEEPFYSAFRGELLLRFGREAEAKPSFAAALKLVDAKIGRAGTAWVDPTAQKIGIFIASRDYRGAVAIADAALARQSDNVRMLTERCRARAEGGFELDKALRDCNRAEEYDPGTVGAAQARALVYFRMARWDQSIADYDRALSFVRNDPYSLHGRGLAKLRKGDAEGGRADIAAGRRYGFDAHVAFEASGITPETTVAGN
jgi:tetratricopeptide (TPR) repeat protein